MSDYQPLCFFEWGGLIGREHRCILSRSHAEDHECKCKATAHKRKSIYR